MSPENTPATRLQGLIQFAMAACLGVMAVAVFVNVVLRYGFGSGVAAREELRQHASGAVLSCSALKRQYRERLRAAAPGLRFVFLEIGREQAQQRVTARAPQQFFSTSLVDSQFATLESPIGEARVLRLDATAALPQLQAEVAAWLQQGETA